MLAVGCSDGRLVIWDFLTRGIAKIISADWSPIYSITWSKKSDLIATSSTDNTVCIWYTSTGRCRTRISCIQSPILKIQFHPRNSSYLLICPLKHPPVLIDNNGKHEIVTIDDEPNDIISTFDRKGEHIILGNSRGLIVLKTFPDLKTISSFRITTGTNSNTILKHIEVPRRGKKSKSKIEQHVQNLCFFYILGPYCLVNTSDRIVRIYSYTEMLSCGIVRDLEPKQKLQDLVNKSLWRKCCWSGDGEYICGASSRQHSLYIWETMSGNLVKILHGTKGETLADVCWHPVRPIIASISSGVVSIWSHSQVENWSAFAPDFRELEENVEYHERESEFDLKDEDRSLDGLDYTGSPNKRQRLDLNGNVSKIMNDDVDIDVVTQQRIEAFVSSDDEDTDDQLVYLPSAPDIEDPDIEFTAKNQTSSSVPIAADHTYEINLETPPVHDIHPYFGGTKQSRLITNTVMNNPDAKRDGRHRRKGHHHQHVEGDQQSILLPKSIDAAVATVINNQKLLTSSNGGTTIIAQTSEIKGQRGRPARLGGKKAAASHHTQLTDMDDEFVPH
jgi:COMPASS component SWD1